MNGSLSDTDVLERVLGILDPGCRGLGVIRRGGRILLGLPPRGAAFRRTLRLYQPQRLAARGMVAATRVLSHAGLHGLLARPIPLHARPVSTEPAIGPIEPGSCGVLLGSPEHRIRRAIASYCSGGRWEVAKISFGGEGRLNLEQEAGVLAGLRPTTAGVPALLGLHRGDGVTVLRMPYLTGAPVPPGDPGPALDLLCRWESGGDARPANSFPEWPAIEAALETSEAGRSALARLAAQRLRPVTCHGDFARWNLLRQPGGDLVVLDWEWGHDSGLPGIDLVHYFCQDARLVRKLDPAGALAGTRADLARPACRAYLERSGWTAGPEDVILACLAYKQGARHQDNRGVLDRCLHEAALAASRGNASA